MKIVVFSGAGVSADSGVKTFRDHGGLWNEHRIEDVATPEAFQKNPELVLDFYNMRFFQLQEVKPNPAHMAIAELENYFDVEVITQNVDDLHERAGSTKVLHLHGELTKCRNIHTDANTFPMPASGLRVGDLCPAGHQLRPHIVWFGELVTKLEEALPIVRSADLLLIVGTSLQVYPAAGLAYEAPQNAEIYLADPGETPMGFGRRLKHLRGRATEIVPKWAEELKKRSENSTSHRM